MDNPNGNGHSKNPLNVIFGEPDELIRVAVLDKGGEPTGVVAVFKPIEPKHKAAYDRIIQKGFGTKKPKYDEGDMYAFPKVIQEIEGLTAEHCDGMEPIHFCQRTEKGQMLLKVFMNGYWQQTLPSTEEDAQKK